MKKITLTIAALAMLLAFGAPLASAHVIGNQPVAKEVSAEEAAAYKAWYDANAKATQTKAYDDYAKALELAVDFLQKFPNSKNAAYLKDKWIPQIRAYMLGQAVAAKNLPEIVRLGKDLVAATPDNVDYPNYLAGQLRS